MNLKSWSNKGTIHIQIMGKGFLRGGEGQSMYNQCKEDWLVGWAKGELVCDEARESVELYYRPKQSINMILL